LVFGLASYFGKELNEVWKVIAQEFSTNNDVLAGVGSEQFGAEEFRFSHDA
jgi:hypothetical protein